MLHLRAIGLRMIGRNEAILIVFVVSRISYEGWYFFFSFYTWFHPDKRCLLAAVLSSRLLTQGLSKGQEDSHLNMRSSDCPPTGSCLPKSSSSFCPQFSKLWLKAPQSQARVRGNSYFLMINTAFLAERIKCECK